MASGNAVKGASRRPVRYPAQLVIMVNDETADRVAADALRGEVSKSEAARMSLEAGLALASIVAEYGVGFTDLVNAARLHAIRASQSAHETTRTE